LTEGVLHVRLLTALGISIGVLAGLFTWVASTVQNLGALASPLVVWVGFAAWACHYAAGGKVAGLRKAIGGNLSGLVWGWLIVQAATLLGGTTVALSVAVAVAAFGMCMQARWALISFIPATFVGAASFFGNDTLVLTTLISLVVGALLGYASEVLGGQLMKIGATQETSSA
jgi:Protein of unknown function (DUF1097)